jgi:hypothetical protein
MQSQCLIQKQINGLPITDHEEYKIEYHLKTRSGVLIAVYDDLERAEEFRQAQIDKWGKSAPVALIFHVITITKQL